MAACWCSDETTLRHLPPLRAAWALRGKQAAVRISGTNARRALFGSLDLRRGRRVVMLRKHQQLAHYHAFSRRRRHGVGRGGALWLRLDRHGRHCSPGRLRLAGPLGIRLFWLPRQHPKLNPVDHRWRGLKNHFAANRQFVSVDELADRAASWVRALIPTQTLRQAGLLSRKCWLKLLAQAGVQDTLLIYLVGSDQLKRTSPADRTWRAPMRGATPRSRSWAAT